jgi:class 3 adenylate cyclase/pSer/pThr/pTyr-binding forkhead associated (FHA) protein
VAREPVPEDFRKVVTVLFCDLTGSTSIGEQLDSESLRRLMRRYFGTMEAILERHGGTVEKFIGDAIMAVFGIPAAREDDALRAVRAAVEMRAALAEVNEQDAARWGVQLRVRTGVNTGEVVAGDPARGHGFVTGDVVNVAARLEQAAQADEILIGGDTHRLVRDAVRVEPVEPLTLKGKSQPVPAFRLLDVAAGAPGVTRRLTSPLVGRERELALLRSAFDRTVADPACTLVPVLGPAGVGKSRLAAELASALSESATVVSGRCLPYGEGITFWPVAEIVRTLAGITEEDGPEAAGEKVAQLLPPDDDTKVIVERIVGVLGLLEVSCYPIEIFWAVRKLLEACAAERALVVVLEDLHWAESTLLELVEYLATSSRSTAILVVVPARTELLERRPALPGLALETISLGPLSGDETRLLVENLLGGGQLEREVADRVLGSGEGNPLFVEELLRLLVDEGRLTREGERWTTSGPLSDVATPPTIQAIVAARLDRLQPEERAVIERAAVIGKLFWPTAVRALSPPEARDEVDDRLEALVQRQLLEPGEGRFAGEDPLAFGHILVRDVVYQSMLKAARADLHERFAGWLEETAGERAVEFEEILGYHLEQGYRHLAEVDPSDARIGEIAGRAAARLGSAGGRALARGDIPAAISLLERASSLLPEDHPARRDLALKLGIALAGAGQLTRVNTLLTEEIAAHRGGRAVVVYHEPTGRQQTFVIGDDAQAVTIGRRAENHIALVWDSQVSREHARLEREAAGWAVVDDGPSRNGTYLNGDRVTGRCAVADGDVLRVGDSILLFRSPEPGKPSAVAADQPDGVTVFGESPLASVQLSDVERRVLRELRGGTREPTAAATPVSDREIAERLSLEEDEVRAAVTALKLKFGVEAASEERRRESLVVRAVSSGVFADPTAG